jgi:hypothetical protein
MFIICNNIYVAKRLAQIQFFYLDLASKLYISASLFSQLNTHISDNLSQVAVLILFTNFLTWFQSVVAEPSDSKGREYGHIIQISNFIFLKAW